MRESILLPDGSLDMHTGHLALPTPVFGLVHLPTFEAVEGGTQLLFKRKIPVGQTGATAWDDLKPNPGKDLLEFQGDLC